MKKNFTLLANGVRPVAKAQFISLFKEVYRWVGKQAFSFDMHREVLDEVEKFSKTYVQEAMVPKRGQNT